MNRRKQRWFAEAMEHIGTGCGPVQVAVKPDLRRLNDDELRQLRELAVKTQPDPGNR